jgi:H+-transporting ATPase
MTHRWTHFVQTKLGIIMMNKLSVNNLVPINGFRESDLVLYGALASQEANQDTIDIAFISAAKERNLLNKHLIHSQAVCSDTTLPST